MQDGNDRAVGGKWARMWAGRRAGGGGKATDSCFCRQVSRFNKVGKSREKVSKSEASQKLGVVRNFFELNSILFHVGMAHEK